ncbi:fumarylacetoacetate hydrolase family protein [Billgrantia antri]|uniref:Fumarylacetoacetate hydrolase family protein n=1 Tax=Billgrantia antri TaxID=2846777 RepID=A0ABS6ZJ51_9GAMM|nr:fumarylacetoacetate hydrolase family protein [Halomonas antri]MBW6390076.1 fumarylacetoacetate hydrolase family protein [Halomonas antri]
MKHARIAYEGRVQQAWEDSGMVRLADGRRVAETEVVWLPPVTPGTILALGLNYADHAAEIASQAPDEPMVFLKGANTLVGHRAFTPRPDDASNMHYECELAIVVGRPARNVTKADAYAYIAGYTVANDYAVRNYLEGFYRPNFRIKSRDNCTPIGPWLVDAADIPDPMDLSLTTRVNGVTTQEGTTRDMLFDVPFLIEYFSSFMTLQPGDLILTGTPKGTVNVMPGDEVVTEIESIGALYNTIIARRP